MRGCNQTAVKKLVLRRGRGGVIGGFDLRCLCHVDKMRQISIAGQNLQCRSKHWYLYANLSLFY